MGYAACETLQSLGLLLFGDGFALGVCVCLLQAPDEGLKLI